MSAGLFLFLWTTACLLVMSCVAVALTRRSHRLNKPNKSTSFLLSKQIQPEKASIDNKDKDLFLVERVIVGMRKLETGLEVTAEARAKLFAAGDALLRKLPTNIRNCLNCPISCDLMDKLSQGDNSENVTPEQVRSAFGVAEASFALQDLICYFGDGINDPYYQMRIIERSGELRVGHQVFSERYVIIGISRGARVSMAVATEMWRGIVEILREGLVSVPGIRAAKSPVEISGKATKIR